MSEHIEWFLEQVALGNIEVRSDCGTWTDIDTGEKFISPCQVSYKNTVCAGCRTFDDTVLSLYKSIVK